jgi:hypothetical protein
VVAGHPHALLSDQIRQGPATKFEKIYDQAVQLLVDLRDLADRLGRVEETANRIRDIRERHASKPSLLKRLEAKRLGR